MNLVCELAGWQTSWRFAASSWLERWMAAAPWEAGGASAHILRLSGDGYLAPFAEALRIEFSGRTRGDVAARCVDVELAAGLDVGASLRSALGLGASSSRGDLSALANELTGKPLLLLVRGGLRDRPVVDELEVLFDSCAKRAGTLRTCAFVLDDVQNPSLGAPRDFCVGWFADSVMPAIVTAAGAVQRLPYLALRLAWEVGGDLGRALEVSAEWRSGVPGDEPTLERELDALARDLWAGQDEASRAMVRDWLDGTVKGTKHALPQAPLIEQRLAWRPPGQERWRVVPWVARVLLNAGPAEAWRPILRACLVPTPLANEVLRRCFELESWVVSMLTRRGGPRAEPPATAVESWNAFRRGAGHERLHYPAGCPASPSDAWAFATLGSVAANLNGRSGEVTRRLRNVRNALAHGHYVSWATIIELVEIEEALKGGV